MIRESGNDSELGRFSWHKLLGKNGHSIVICTAYQPCNMAVTRRRQNSEGVEVEELAVGPSTVVAQQYSILAEHDRLCHPRQAFMEDLRKNLLEWRQQGCDIILGGDFNESLREPNSALASLAEDFQLHDVYASLHGGSNAPATYNRGSRCILDYIFMTERLVSQVKESGYLAFGDCIASDHRGQFVDLDTTGFLGGTPDHIAKFQISPEIYGNSRSISPGSSCDRTYCICREQSSVGRLFGTN